MHVSIVICTRNRASQLAGTLESLGRVASSLTWEAVIVDNASTDDTREVIEAAARANPHIRYEHETQLGLGAARRAGVGHAKGEIIGLTDDDCYVTPDYVDALYAVFEEHPDVGVAGGRILLFDPQDAPITIDTRDTPVDMAPRTVVRTGAFHGANLAFRRSAIVEAGSFDARLGAGTPFPVEDVDAVAAVVWAGHAARFDPRPVIQHHHQRREADIVPQIWKFDRGRGAYYMKYVLRADTRAAYLADWRARTGPIWKLTSPPTAFREASSGLDFAFRYGTLGQKLAILPQTAAYIVAAYLQRIPIRLRRRIDMLRDRQAATQA